MTQDAGALRPHWDWALEAAIGDHGPTTPPVAAILHEPGCAV
jgi:hypothetical protein